MQPKSERFEMRLETEILDSIDAWRKDESDFPSRSEAVRRLVEVGLSTTRSKHPQLSDGEKLILLTLGDMTKKLKLNTELEPDFIASVIYGGHYWGLDWKYTGIFHRQIDKPQTVSEVVDILDMWSFLEEGFEQLSEQGRDQVKVEAAPFGEHVSFPGFDGNNECEHGSIARFLVEKLERFSSLGERAGKNSHMPTLAGYRRMLSVFLPIRHTIVGRRLSASEIIKILNARRHQD